MKPDVAEILNAALRLPVEDRIELVNLLYSTFQGVAEEADHAQKWTKVCERRFAEMESGAVQGIPLDEVLRASKSRASALPVTSRE